MPKFSSKKNPSLFLEHRKNFKNGNIRTELSGTVENQTVHQLKTNKKRGHIKTSGFFNLGDDTFLDFNIHKTTDRNYLNTYKYGYKDVLESNFKIQKHIRNNFYSLDDVLLLLTCNSGYCIHCYCVAVCAKKYFIISCTKKSML